MKIAKQLLVGLMVLTLLVAVIQPLFPAKTYAATLESQAQLNAFVRTLKFRDGGTIVGKVGEEDVHFTLGKADTGSAAAFQTINTYVSNDLFCGPDKAKISTANPMVLTVKLSSGGSCNNTPVTKTLALNQNSPAARIMASNLDEDTLVIVKPVTFGFGANVAIGEKFIRKPGSNLFYRDKESGDKCQDFIRTDANGGVLFELQDSGDGHSGDNIGDSTIGSCRILSINGKSTREGTSDPEVKELARTSRFPIGKITEAELGQLNGANGSGNEEPDSCDTNSSGPLGWIICPIIDMANSFASFVFTGIVRPFLENVPVSAKPGEPTYEAWKQFRIIGNIVLIGTMLAVVYAQAKGDR